MADPGRKSDRPRALGRAGAGGRAAGHGPLADDRRRRHQRGAAGPGDHAGGAAGRDRDLGLCRRALRSRRRGGHRLLRLLLRLLGARSARTARADGQPGERARDRHVLVRLLAGLHADDVAGRRLCRTPAEALLGPLCWLVPLAIAVGYVSPAALEIVTNHDRPSEPGAVGARDLSAMARIDRVTRWSGPLLIGTVLGGITLVLITAIAGAGSGGLKPFWRVLGVAAMLSGSLLFLWLIGKAAARGLVKKSTPRVSGNAIFGPAREVWDNPVLWREWKTQAYGRLSTQLKWLTGIGLLAMLPPSPATTSGAAAATAPYWA